MLGYPEQAARISDAKDAHVRRRGHPFDLGWALSFGAQVLDYLGEPDQWLKRIEEADRVGRENSLPAVTECLVPAASGPALILKGQTAEGTALLERGIAFWEEAGGQTASPYWKTVLAEGMAQLGDLDGALEVYGDTDLLRPSRLFSGRCSECRRDGHAVPRRRAPTAGPRARGF
jgi:hypothetical protein